MLNFRSAASNIGKKTVNPQDRGCSSNLTLLKVQNIIRLAFPKKLVPFNPNSTLFNLEAYVCPWWCALFKTIQNRSAGTD